MGYLRDGEDHGKPSTGTRPPTSSHPYPFLGSPQLLGPSLLNPISLIAHLPFKDLQNRMVHIAEKQLSFSQTLANLFSLDLLTHICFCICVCVRTQDLRKPAFPAFQKKDGCFSAMWASLFWSCADFWKVSEWSVMGWGGAHETQWATKAGLWRSSRAGWRGK